MTGRSTARVDTASAARPAGPGADFALREAIVALGEEMRQTREEFVELRTTLLQGERKGHLLSEAFRQVLVQMTELFEAQRQENLTREEALRFFLNSIEVRLMNRSQGASRDGETASPAEPVDGGRRGGRRRWFRSSR